MLKYLQKLFHNIIKMSQIVVLMSEFKQFTSKAIALYL